MLLNLNQGSTQKNVEHNWHHLMEINYCLVYLINRNQLYFTQIVGRWLNI